MALAGGCSFDFDRELGQGEIRGRVFTEGESGSLVPANGAEIRLV